MLANDTRLRLFAELLRQQPQSVLQIAEALALTPPVASQALRALEARGLLKVRRIRRFVEYRVTSSDEAGAPADLIAALRSTLARESRPAAQIIELATGFTHPTRIEVCRLLHTGPHTQLELQAKLKISRPALSRHLAKLQRRGYVVRNKNNHRFAITEHPHVLGHALAELALA